MAILKYTDANGITHSVNSYKINNVIVTQEKGESTADVMSQKAVTDEIKKVNSSITSETNRATTAENKIKTDLTTEINKKVATVTIEKDSTNDLQYHLLVDGENSGDINIPKDQFLSNVVYSSATKVITFTFETSTGTKTTDVNISDLIDTYTAGDGLTLVDNKFSVKKDVNTQSYIEVSASGVKVVGIDEALALKADKTDVYTTAQVDEKVNLKANAADVYTRDEIDTLTATMDGGEF